LLEYFPYSLALAVKQHEVALREQLDVLHVHYAIPHAPAAFLAKQMLEEDHEIKVVTTLHGTDITLVGQESSFFTVTKFAMEKSDAVTAVSSFLAEETYEAFGCRACNIEVIPNFVSPKVYYPQSDEANEIRRLGPPDCRVLAHISNFREVKRVPDVVRIFARVREAIPAVLVLAGDGPQRQETEAEAERLGVAKDVLFLGKIDAVADLLRAADLYMLPSATESFGLSALEAMACGVPVIGSRAGGLGEVVVDGETGYLAPVGDVDQMAENAIDLLRDIKKFADFRAAAVERAHLFHPDRVVSLYERLYERLTTR
jgi:N-acetyl-alpha-D-glucosaminyl L-malate synthase BshA